MRSGAEVHSYPALAARAARMRDGLRRLGRKGPVMRKPATTAAGARTGRRAPGVSSLYEMMEFAGFPKAAQRYIRRSLDVGLERRDAVERWARSAAEAAAIEEQARVYRGLERVRASVPDDSDPAAAEALMAPLIGLIAFDLGEGRLSGFASCRFLYERLVGAAIRPWLPAAFAAAATLPHLHPERRRMLLQSLTEDVAAAPGWSVREPVFFPEWVDKIDPSIAC
jgi:hypothetical protein